jgi:transmembrane sensor
MMNERETSKAISDAAAGWVARVDAAPGDAAVQQELGAWLAGNERRRGAYLRARAAWAMLDRAQVLGASVDVPETNSRSWSLVRLAWPGGAIAACLLLAIWSSVAWRGGTDHTPLRLATSIGEIRHVPLADGSMAEINTDSAVSVALAPDVRRISLDRGEAFFKVAHDKARPFIVAAGDVRVEAVGTAFAVRRSGGGVEVQVTEGRVLVWDIAHPGERRLVGSGSRATIARSDPGREVVSAPDDRMDRTLAWRSGQLIFDGDTLASAAAEFNRYNKVKIRIGDPALANERLVGRFRTNEPDAFAEAASAMLGAAMEERADSILLTRK